MMQLGITRRSVCASFVTAMMLAAMMLVIGQRPAAAATSVRGNACGYYTNVGLFGGPQTLKGCGTSVPTTDLSYSPNVNLPSGGSASAIQASDSDGAAAQYGPSTVFGGIWPDDAASAPPSGPISVSTQGTPAGGTVTSSSDISLFPTPITVTCETGFSPPCTAPGGFGPFPVWGDSLHVQCNASATSVTGSTTLSNAFVAHATDAGGAPLASATESIPNNPPVNFTRDGVITNVGDVFTVVFNEQIVNTDGSLTVNAVHMYLFGPTAVGEIVKGQVTCGTTPSPLTRNDTAPPTCGTPVVEPVGPDDPTPKSPRTELVGVFDAYGLQSITNIQATNGTVQVGVPGGAAYLQLTPGQTGPLQITATRTSDAEAANLLMSWSFDATDAAGNVRHCRGYETPPVAGSDSYSINEDTTLNVSAPGVLGNDSDVDNDTLTAGSASTPAHGSVTLNSDGSFTYTPAANYNGTDSFTYVVSDGRGGSATGTVTISIAPVQDPPVAVNDSYHSGMFGVGVAAPGVLGNDYDPDGDALTASLVSGPSAGTLSFNPDGSFTYNPNLLFFGTDTFTYRVSDGHGNSATATVTMDVGLL